MSQFNGIDYENYDNYEEKNKPIYRKLRIIDENIDENINENIDENIDENMVVNNNKYTTYNKDKYGGKTSSNSETFKTIDLNSTLNYNNRNKLNRYYDSYTNRSFNDINDLNDIKFGGKKDKLIMEIDDTKNTLRNNIQNVYERDNKLNDLNDKSTNLLDGTEKFKLNSNYLKRRMYFNYLCHFASIILTCLFIITFIIVLLY